MRYDAEHKQRSRERVMNEAAKAIRAEGPPAVSVAGVMGAAGLTHGAFYAHFESRRRPAAGGRRSGCSRKAARASWPRPAGVVRPRRR